MIPSYIRDTTDFINKLEAVNDLPKIYYLVTMDVTSLYTNIPNHEGLTAVAQTLKRHKPSYRLSYQSLISLLRIVLHCNNFHFEGETYLQVGGTAMGSKLAPSYANIFMGELERKMLLSAPYKPHIYLRYIDDIFIIWTGTLVQLQEFYNHCNNFHKSIKFTIEISQEQITFLDTVVKRNTDGKIKFDLYCKPTDKHCYLHFHSNHPECQKRAGPYSQFLRIKRICSDNKDFEKHAQNLVQFYLRQGYPDKMLKTNLEKAKLADRNNLLHPQNIDKDSNNRMPFVLTYDRDIFHFKRAITRLWPLLSINHPQMFANPPIFALKIGKKLSDNLIRAEFNTKTRGQTGRIFLNPVTDCDTQNCKYCKLMHKSKIFISSYTKYKYTCALRGHCTTRNLVYLITCTECAMQYVGETKRSYTKYKYTCALRGHCTTRNLVYLITCTECAMQYVGETKREIKVRMTEHRRDILKKRDTPVALHFNLYNHSPDNMRFQIIEILKTDPDSDKSTDIRRKKELHWIYQLHTLRPVGINVQG